MLLNHIVVGPSTIHGSGLFATQPIPRGTVVWHPCRQCTVVEGASLAQLSPRQVDWYDEFGFRLDSGALLLPCGGAHLMNHSCQANVLDDGLDFGVAVRDIAAGQEIFCDFRTFAADPDWSVACQCATAACDGMIAPRGADDRVRASWAARIAAALAALKQVAQPLEASLLESSVSYPAIVAEKARPCASIRHRTHIGAPMQPSWSDVDTKEFLDAARFFVPDREDQIEILCNAVPRFVGDFRVVDLCCGEGLLSMAIAERFPAASFRLLDGSEAMLARARDNLGDRAVCERFALEAQSWRASFPVAELVVSSLAIHHLDAHQKRQLFQDVYRMLSDGGAFLIADLILPTRPEGTAIAGDFWDRAVKERSQRILGDASAFHEFRRTNWNNYREATPDPVDKPSGLFEQLQWLDAAGFADVDVFWMKAGHGIFGGYRR